MTNYMGKTRRFDMSPTIGSTVKIRMRYESCSTAEETRETIEAIA